jgi:hypothetical protein
MGYHCAYGRANHEGIYFVKEGEGYALILFNGQTHERWECAYRDRKDGLPEKMDVIACISGHANGTL